MEGQGPVEPLERGLVALGGDAVGLEALQHRRDRRVSRELCAQHDVAALALALQARREVDGRAEIVEPVVERDDDAGP